MKTVISTVAAVAIATAALAAQGAAPAAQAPAPGAWHAFEGSWSASGQRQALPTEGGQPAQTVQLSGAVAVTAGEGLSRGFRGEVVGFDDGAGLTVGHVVWTDERGDRIFSRINGDALASGRRIVGAISGGTGRYVGITGEYAFEWQYVIAPEAGTISGRAVGLRGRYRAGGAGR
jgi:hypothetical protein